jgi:hypothetical protein
MVKPRNFGGSKGSASRVAPDDFSQIQDRNTYPGKRASVFFVVVRA